MPGGGGLTLSITSFSLREETTHRLVAWMFLDLAIFRETIFQRALWR